MECKLEQVPTNEHAATQSLIKLLTAKITREKSPNGEVLRDAHPKQHGLVKAKFIINKDLPAQYRIGIFSAPQTFDAWLRFSNQSAPIQADKDKDIRGLAVKLLNVPGKKLLTGHENDNNHDFITISTDAFITKDVAEFNALIKSIIKSKLSALWFFLFHWRVVKNLINANRQFVSPLAIQYFSCTPYLLGDTAVKYTIRPREASKNTLPKTPTDSYLKDIMKQQLRTESVCFDFMIQLQSDPKAMPIEDPGVAWDQKKSPFYSVATIEIPKQEFDSPAQHQYGIEMSFNPWRCLKEHRPLGGINRARKFVYEAISKYRHHENGTQLTEPTAMVDFSASAIPVKTS